MEAEGGGGAGGGGGGSVKIVKVNGLATEVRDTNCNKGAGAEVAEDKVTTGDDLIAVTEIGLERVVVADRLEEEATDDVVGAIKFRV